MDGRVFGLDQQTLISIVIQLINAAILAVVLTRILYKPVREFMRKRSQAIQTQFDRAQAELESADKLKGFYEQRLAEIEQERAGLLDEARKLGAEQRGRIVDDAKKEATLLRERASSAIVAERERVNEEIRLQIIEVAAAMAEKFVEHAIDEQSHDRLFAATLAELEDRA